MTGEGERLEAGRRRKFWTLILGLAGVGAVGGFVFGFAAGYADSTDHPLARDVRLAAAAALLLSLFGAAYLSWRFFKSADEVEVADNLWGSLIGFYAYCFTFPAWWALSWLRLAPEPDGVAIFAAAMTAAAAAYGYRKWQAR